MTFSGGGSDVTLSQTFKGFGVGAGVRHALAGNSYLFADWHHIMGREAEFKDDALLGPNNAIKLKPTTTTGLIGVGWTFP